MFGVTLTERETHRFPGSMEPPVGWLQCVRTRTSSRGLGVGWWQTGSVAGQVGGRAGGQGTMGRW